MHKNAPNGLMQCVHEVTDDPFSNVRWTVNAPKNWMDDELGMTGQKDGSSCGCYCL